MCPVDHLDLELVLELAQLAGRELAVTDHGVRGGSGTVSASSATLPEPMKVAGSGRLAAGPGHRVPASGGLARRPAPSTRPGPARRCPRSRRHEHDPFEAQLPVLDSVMSVGSWRGPRPGAASRGPSARARRRGSVGSVREKFSHRGRHTSTTTPAASRGFRSLSRERPRDGAGGSARSSVMRRAPSSPAPPVGQPPEATSTAGPAAPSCRRRPSPAGGRPRVHPDVARRLPAARSAATTAATVPVPQERVFPTPRSCTRIATRPSRIAETNSTFTLREQGAVVPGLRGQVQRVQALSVTQARCGSPTSTAVPVNAGLSTRRRHGRRAPDPCRRRPRRRATAPGGSRPGAERQRPPAWSASRRGRASGRRPARRCRTSPRRCRPRCGSP